MFSLTLYKYYIKVLRKIQILKRLLFFSPCRTGCFSVQATKPSHLYTARGSAVKVSINSNHNEFSERTFGFLFFLLSILILYQKFRTFSRFKDSKFLITKINTFPQREITSFCYI